MAASLDNMAAHGKQNKVTYMINLFGSVIPIVMFLAYASTQISGLTSAKDVARMIDVHFNDLAHPAAVSEIQNIQGQLDNLLSLQIEIRIEAQLKIICENSQLRSAIEPTVKQLIRDYNEVSKKDYSRPSCAQLGVSIP